MSAPHSGSLGLLDLLSRPTDDTAPLPCEVRRLRSARDLRAYACILARKGLSVLVVDSHRGCSEAATELEIADIPHLYEPDIATLVPDERDRAAHALVPTPGLVLLVPVHRVRAANWGVGRFDLVLVSLRAGYAESSSTLVEILRARCSVDGGAGYRVSGVGLTAADREEYTERLRALTQSVAKRARVEHPAHLDAGDTEEDMSRYASWGGSPRADMEARLAALGAGDVLDSPPWESADRLSLTANAARWRVARHSKEHAEKVLSTMLLPSGLPLEEQLLHRELWELMPYGLISRFRATFDPGFAAGVDRDSLEKRPTQRPYLARTVQLLWELLDDAGIDIGPALLGTEVRIGPEIRARLVASILRDEDRRRDAKMLLNMRPSPQQIATKPDSPAAVARVANTLMERLGFTRDSKPERKQSDRKRVVVSVYRLRWELIAMFKRATAGGGLQCPTERDHLPGRALQTTDTIGTLWAPRVGVPVEVPESEKSVFARLLPSAGDPHFVRLEGLQLAIDEIRADMCLERAERTRGYVSEVEGTVGGIIYVPRKVRREDGGRRYVGGHGSGPALQSVAKKLRPYLGAPEGRSFISFDWSNMHFKIAAQLSGDEKMLEDADSGTYYDETALAYGVTRALAKAGVSATLNNGDAGTLTRLGFSRANAVAFQARFVQCYPVFVKWGQSKLHEWKRLNHKTKLAKGFLVDVEKEGSVFSRQYCYVESEAISKVLLRLQEHTAPLGLRMVLPMHDGALLDVPTERAVEAIVWLEGVLREAWAGGFKIGAGSTWGEAETETIPYRYDPLLGGKR
ncbi:MAG: hypothetical protein Q8P18_33255 [Pseudomonadota bacterium]|nr:hypothetical protein [Pseudomonadota bacterium]